MLQIFSRGARKGATGAKKRLLRSPLRRARCEKPDCFTFFQMVFVIFAALKYAL